MARVLLVLALLVSRADAMMMEHYDLTGLALQSEAIVIADRTVGKPSRFHVTKTLRGSIAAGTDLELDDELYQEPGRTFETRVWLFVQRREGKLYIVPSGLRVVEGGVVFRFEQWRNPGGWTPVPQGPDPSDQWRGGAAIDVPEFERELAAAMTRADALTAVLAQPKPTTRAGALARDAKLFALLAPAGDARAQGGFYRDEAAARVESAFADAGDIEGALLALGHDHTGIDFGHRVGSAAQLSGVAATPSTPLAIRVAAIHAIAEANTFSVDEDSLRVLVALFADPSPVIRAAAVTTSSQTFDWSSSDAAAQSRTNKLRAQVRTGMQLLATTEASNLVLHALAAAYNRAHLRVPERKGLPAFAATVAIRAQYLQVDVQCLRGVVGKPSRIIATRDGKPWQADGFNISVSCGDGLGGGGTHGPLATGTYELAVEVLVGKASVVIPLGAMAVGANGELALAPL